MNQRLMFKRSLALLLCFLMLTVDGGATLIVNRTHHTWGNP